MSKNNYYSYCNRSRFLLSMQLSKFKGCGSKLVQQIVQMSSNSVCGPRVTSIPIIIQGHQLGLIQGLDHNTIDDIGYACFFFKQDTSMLYTTALACALIKWGILLHRFKVKGECSIML